MRKREKKRQHRIQAEKDKNTSKEGENGDKEVFSDGKECDKDDSDEENVSTKDDLLIPLSNDWVCQKIRDGSAPSGYITNYWSPSGERFSTLDEIEKHCQDNGLDIDLQVFKTTCLTQPEDKETKVRSVRVRDHETGLPLVIIFQEGQNMLTLNEKATV